MNGANTWTRIAHCSDIPLREGRAVKVGDREIAIFNLGEHFLAIENRCPHKGGPLADGMVWGSAVVCPLHAWKLSIETGKGVTGPSTGSCVKTYRTRVEDEIVLLDLCDARIESEPNLRAEVPAICVQQGGMAATTDHTSAAEA